MNKKEDCKNKNFYERAQQTINSLMKLNGKLLQDNMIVEKEYDSQYILFTE